MEKYTDNQTPIERLRNKLTPFITLAEILHRDKDFDVDGLIKTCNLFKNDIHSYLYDCENFYKNKELDFAYWLFKNEFILSQDGEWYSGLGQKFTKEELYLLYKQNTNQI